MLAVPFDAAADVISAAGDLTGKTLVDITNPMTADYSAFTVGHTTQRGRRNPEACAHGQVVKAFNTVFASVLQAGGKVAGHPATVFVAGDDADARKSVSDLAASAGLVPIETGELVPPGTWSRSRGSTSRSPTASAKAPTSLQPGSALPDLISHKQGPRS